LIDTRVSGLYAKVSFTVVNLGASDVLRVYNGARVNESTEALQLVGSYPRADLADAVFTGRYVWLL
jgi:hypothetical protein